MHACNIFLWRNPRNTLLTRLACHKSAMLQTRNATSLLRHHILLPVLERLMVTTEETLFPLSLTGGQLKKTWNDNQLL